MEHGWSLKHLHRLIVDSATYRQSSRVDARAAGRATRTTACWPAGRGSASRPRSCATSRWRPAACSTRRSAARASSRPRPAFLFQPPASYGPKVWHEATGADRYRRALYTFRYRSVPYPVLQTFDAPNGDFACVRRGALQHAASGADDPERAALPRMRPGPGPADAARRRGSDAIDAAGLRLPPLPGARADRAEIGTSARRSCTSRPARFADGRRDALGRWRPTTRPSRPQLPAGRDARRSLPPGRPSSRVLLNLDETSRRNNGSRADVNELPGPSLPERRPAAGRPPLVPRSSAASAWGDGARPAAGRGGLRRAPASGVDPLAPKAPHFAPKAKRVIFLFMAGAPSHLELFDNKPQLAKFDGTLPPPELLKGYRAAFINPNSKLLGPKFKFARHGQCGAELSELLPHLAEVVDDIAIVKSMVTDAFNHAPGQILMNTGSQQFGRPSLGAWVTYGLGSESQDLPGFVVFSTGKKGPERRQLELGQRLPADRLPGRPVPHQRRPGAVPLQPARRRPRAAARLARRRRQL